MAVKAQIDLLGKQPGKERLREAIMAICSVRPWSRAEELATYLGARPEGLTTLHLLPMVTGGQLVLRYPQDKNHPEQAFGLAK